MRRGAHASAPRPVPRPRFLPPSGLSLTPPALPAPRRAEPAVPGRGGRARPSRWRRRTSKRCGRRYTSKPATAPAAQSGAAPQRLGRYCPLRALQFPARAGTLEALVHRRSTNGRCRGLRLYGGASPLSLVSPLPRSCSRQAQRTLSGCRWRAHCCNTDRTWTPVFDFRMVGCFRQCAAGRIAKPRRLPDRSPGRVAVQDLDEDLGAGSIRAREILLQLRSAPATLPIPQPSIRARELGGDPEIYRPA